jgi:hypothetical protein
MENFSSSVELIRLVFLLGAIFAIMYKKQYGVTPGGVIVPGTLAILLASSSSAFLITVAVTICTWFTYKAFLSKYALIGRWSTIANVIISVIFCLVAIALSDKHHDLDLHATLLSLIVPGLISASARKYGPMRVSTGLLITVSGTFIAGAILGQIIPHSLVDSVQEHMHYPELTLSHPLVVLPVSLLTAIALYFKYRSRGAGYLISPFIAVVLTTSFIQSAMLAIAVLLSYATVKLSQRFTLIIGLDRFMLSLLCGYIAVSVMDIIASHYHISGYHSSALILIVAIAVLTNDLCLQPLRKSLAQGISPAILISYIAKVAI